MINHKYQRKLCWKRYNIKIINPGISQSNTNNIPGNVGGSKSKFGSLTFLGAIDRVEKFEDLLSSCLPELIEGFI